MTYHCIQGPGTGMLWLTNIVGAASHKSLHHVRWGWTRFAQCESPAAAPTLIHIPTALFNVPSPLRKQTGRHNLILLNCWKRHLSYQWALSKPFVNSTLFLVAYIYQPSLYLVRNERHSVNAEKQLKSPTSISIYCKLETILYAESSNCQLILLQQDRMIEFDSSLDASYLPPLKPPTALRLLC